MQKYRQNMLISIICIVEVKFPEGANWFVFLKDRQKKTQLQKSYLLSS